MMSQFPGVITRAGELFDFLFFLMRILFNQSLGTISPGCLKLFKEAFLLHEASSNVVLNVKHLVVSGIGDP